MYRRRPLRLRCHVGAWRSFSPSPNPPQVFLTALAQLLNEHVGASDRPLLASLNRAVPRDARLTKRERARCARVCMAQAWATLGS